MRTLLVAYCTIFASTIYQSQGLGARERAAKLRGKWGGNNVLRCRRCFFSLSLLFFILFFFGVFNERLAEGKRESKWWRGRGRRSSSPCVPSSFSRLTWVRACLLLREPQVKNTPKKKRPLFRLLAVSLVARAPFPCPLTKLPAA